MGVIAVVIGAAACESLAVWLLPHLTYRNAPLRGVVPVGAAEVLGFMVWLQFQLHWMNRSILNDNPNLCRVCGYDLRETPTRCPECGNCPAVLPNTSQV